MSPFETLKRSRADGLSISLYPDGGLRIIGEAQTLERWVEPLRSHRTPILAWLRDESQLREWLIADGDTADGIEEVLECCGRDTQARDYFLTVARRTLLSDEEKNNGRN